MRTLLILFLSIGFSGLLSGQDTMVIYLNDSVFVRTITNNGKLISEEKIRTGYDKEYTEWLFNQGLYDDVFAKAFRNKIQEHRKKNYYNEKGELIRTEVRSENGPAFNIHYIPGKMISLKTKFTETCFPSGSEVNIEIELFSHTDKEICLKVYNTDSTVCVLPMGNLKSFVNFKISEGAFMDSIRVSNDSISKSETISFFGYNFTSSDFEKTGKKEISRNVYYYRSGNEALMNIYSLKKKEPIKRITLGNFKNVIKLYDLKKGEYIFEVVDYTNNTKKKLNVLIK